MQTRFSANAPAPKPRRIIIEHRWKTLELLGAWLAEWVFPIIYGGIGLLFIDWVHGGEELHAFVAIMLAMIWPLYGIWLFIAWAWIWLIFAAGLISAGYLLWKSSLFRGAEYGGH